MRAPLTLLAAAALIGACGGGSSSSDGDGGVVAADAAEFPDSGPACGATWTLVDVPATAIALIDPAPANNARSVRVVVTAEMTGCQELAPPTVGFAFEAEDAVVQMRAWQKLNAVCTDEIRQVERPVTMVLPRPGSWTIHAGSETASVEVNQAPSRPCAGGGGPCEMDCDCAAGERCLGGNGFGGPFLACAVPCELDRDCLRGRDCTSVADGLSWACEPGSIECTGAPGTCPRGFTCFGGTCEADYLLGADTRVPCACDDECAEGLRCVEAQRPGERRCEVACPTAASGYCTTGHRCGPPEQDIAGLAASDAVCIWDGD